MPTTPRPTGSSPRWTPVPPPPVARSPEYYLRRRLPSRLPSVSDFAAEANDEFSSATVSAANLSPCRAIARGELKSDWSMPPAESYDPPYMGRDR